MLRRYGTQNIFYAISGKVRPIQGGLYPNKSHSKVQTKKHPATSKNGMAPHNIMAFVKHLLVVGCLCRFALRTQHGIRLGCAKGQ
jgi:hypothetical protein